MISIIMLALLGTATAQSPLICEDTISAQPPFNNNHIPCLLGCGTPLAMATGSLLPGSVNTTAIPYCRLDCVRTDATPQQSLLAPGCSSKCENGNAATPDQLGWCMYWCVEGGAIEDLVVSTTCVPQLEYEPVATSTINTNFVVTVEGFATPAAWASWYATQTVLSRSSLIGVGPIATTSGSIAGLSQSTSMASGTSSGSTTPFTTTTAMSGTALSGTAAEEQSVSQTTPSIATTTSAASVSSYHNHVHVLLVGLILWILVEYA